MAGVVEPVGVSDAARLDRRHSRHLETEPRRAARPARGQRLALGAQAIGRLLYRLDPGAADVVDLRDVQHDAAGSPSGGREGGGELRRGGAPHPAGGGQGD